MKIPFSPAVDFHIHLGFSRDGGRRTLAETLADLHRYGFSHGVVFPIDEARRGRTYAPLNRRIAEAVRRHRQLIGIARLNPRAGSAALEELHRSLALGLRGVKLHPRAEQFYPGHARRLLAEVAKTCRLLILHTSHEPNCTPRAWELLAREFAKVTFIFMHAGKDRFHDAIRVARALPNVYLETSTLSLFRTRIILEELGARKLVFGSDAPYSHPELELRKFELLASPRDRRAILGANPARILNL